MNQPEQDLDILCIGHASYDLVFSISHHPAADEKTTADGLLGCGGGPAANAAVCAARLGFKAGFCGYLGRDIYGDSHFREFQEQQVDTRWLVRGELPTPLSAVLVKPDGKRCLINFKGETRALPADRVDLSGCRPKAVLCDGHEPAVSLKLLARLAGEPVPTVLDAGSVHAGTLALLDKVAYLVCSEKFAVQYAGDAHKALRQLAEIAPNVVITMGERGLLWQCGQDSGTFPAPHITPVVDTTGAGDAFHGAFTAGLAAGMHWTDLLGYASAAGALCCTKLGARPGMPSHRDLHEFLGRK